MWMKLLVKDSRGPRYKGWGTLLWVLTPLPVSHSEDQREVPLCFCHAEGNSVYFIICPENYSQLQLLLAFMCHLCVCVCVCVCVGAEGGDSQEVLVKVIAQGHRLTARITVILQNAFLPLHPVLCSTGAQTHYKNKNHTTKCFPSPTPNTSATPVGLLCNWGTR